MVKEKGVTSLLFSLAFAVAGSQKSSGSWEETVPSLNAVINTTQSLLFLNDFKCGYFKKQVKSGCVWLTRPDVVGSQYSYWRLLPLILCKEEKSKINDAWEHTERLTKNKLLHHENTPLPMFYVYCSALIGKKTEYCNKLIMEFQNNIKNHDLKVSAETVSHQLVALAMHNKNLAERYIDIALKHIEDKSHREGSYLHWANLVSTAYIMLNLIDLTSIFPNRKDEIFSKFIKESFNYVFHQFEKKNFDSELLAGGENDINRQHYVPVVCGRALIAYLNNVDKGWQQEYWANKFKQNNSRFTYSKILNLALFMFLLARYSDNLSFSWINDPNLLSKGADYIAWATLIFGSFHWTIKKLNIIPRLVQINNFFREH